MAEILKLIIQKSPQIIIPTIAENRPNKSLPDDSTVGDYLNCLERNIGISNEDWSELIQYIPENRDVIEGNKESLINNILSEAQSTPPKKRIVSSLFLAMDYDSGEDRIAGGLNLPGTAARFVQFFSYL